VGPPFPYLLDLNRVLLEVKGETMLIRMGIQIALSEIKMGSLTADDKANQKG
jgi:hypothetical protein